MTIRSSGYRAKDMMYQLREEENRKFLFLCNVTKQEKPHFFDITGPNLPNQECNVSVKGTYRVISLDTATGEMYPVKYIHRDGKTWLAEKIYAAQSRLYLLEETEEEENDSQCAELQFDEKEPEIAAELIPCGYSLEEPNVLLLDMPEYAINDDKLRAPEEILRIQRIINKELDYHKGFAQPWSDKRADTREDELLLRFQIESDIEGIQVSLGIEHPEYSVVFWNGEKISSVSEGWYVDEAIEVLPLGKVKAGNNELIVRTKIGPKTCVEPMYLLGNFGVRIMGRKAALTMLPEILQFGDVKNQGLGFYSGNYTYQCYYESDGEPCRLECHDFSAPLLGITVDKERVGSIYTAPYEIKLGALAKGKHRIDITVFGNRYNTFGPLHNSDDNYQWYGECAWETQGAYFSYEYHLKPFGIFTSPRILKQ